MHTRAKEALEKERHGEEQAAKPVAQKKKKHDPLSKRKNQITYLAALVGLERDLSLLRTPSAGERTRGFAQG